MKSHRVGLPTLRIIKYFKHLFKHFVYSCLNHDLFIAYRMYKAYLAGMQEQPVTIKLLSKKFIMFSPSMPGITYNRMKNMFHMSSNLMFSSRSWQ